MDEKDSLIYLIQNENGRAELTEVARELGFSPPSTKDRLQKLISGQEIMVKALLNWRLLQSS